MEFLVSYQSTQIKLAIALQLQRLQRESIPTLTYENIEDTLKYLKWKREFPNTLHQAINDILSLSADEIVQLLSSRAIIDGYRADINDFGDLLGGKINEQE